jgi:hypothetical protein
MSLLSRRPFVLDRAAVALEISAETLSQRTYATQKTNYKTNKQTNKQKPKAKFLVIQTAHKTHTHTRNKTLG